MRKTNPTGRRRGRLVLTLIAATLAVPGCVSTVSTVETPQPYSGTRYFARQWPMGTGGGNPAGALLGTVFNLFAPLDLPFSFVLDTLLLPFTGIYALATLERSAVADPGPTPSPPPRPHAGIVPRRAPMLILLDASPAMRQVGLEADGRARREARWLLTSIRDGTPVALMDTAGRAPWSGLRSADDEARRLASEWLARGGEPAVGLHPAVTALLGSGVEQLVLLTTLTRRAGEEAPPAEVTGLFAELKGSYSPRCTLDVIAVGPLAQGQSGADDVQAPRRLAAASGGRLEVVPDLR